jgi:hypothetical protein
MKRRSYDLIAISKSRYKKLKMMEMKKIKIEPKEFWDDKNGQRRFIRICKRSIQTNG